MEDLEVQVPQRKKKTNQIEEIPEIIYTI